MSILRIKDRKSLDPLDYEIFDYSSQASAYHPENIKTNEITDPNSRWSTINNDHRQFITLKCEECVVCSITFGKFSKIHVCNVKEMKISVSYDNETYREVFYGGLRNDTEPETFTLKTKEGGEFIVSRYIKIEPLAAWGMNFNYSIWYVALYGVRDVKSVLEDQKRKTKRTLLKNCLKTLKCLGYTEEYNSLKIKVKEDTPFLTQIKHLLDKEAFEECEEFILGLEETVFDGFIRERGYVGKWEEIVKGREERSVESVKGREERSVESVEGSNKLLDNNNIKDINITTDWPCERGGHQMVSLKGKVYLYGGWNGIEELGDFWVYEKGVWVCITPDRLSSDFSLSPIGPGKRSCHKMATDGERLFLLGKYISTITRDSKPVENDIWVYDRGWYILRCKDKHIPSNTYDHHIVFGDGHLYCFGGKQTDDDETYGGLYKLDVKDERSEDHRNLSLDCQLMSVDDDISINSSGCFEAVDALERWTVIREDLKQPLFTPILRGRLGHTVVYIPKDHLPDNVHNNSLAIVGGQRGKENFKEIQFYSLDYDTVYETVPFPIKTEGRIIQRTHLYGEDLIFLFTFGSDKDSKLDTFSLFSYSLTRDKWSEISVEEGPSPLPRSAHQFILHNNSSNNSLSHSFFLLFGGNVIDKSDKRQNDFWKLSLKRISREEVRRIVQFTVRKYKVLSLLDRGRREEAVGFLQKEVKPLVNSKETEAFDKLCCEFFNRKDESDAFEEISKLLNK